MKAAYLIHACLIIIVGCMIGWSHWPASKWVRVLMAMLVGAVLYISLRLAGFYCVVSLLQ